jgi:formate dehydrogenase gamma subunit
MSAQANNRRSSNNKVQVEKTFLRFTLGQRWEHGLLFLSFTLLFLTGLPQKFRTATWSQQILSSPERLDFFRQIHHIAAIVLIATALYHFVRAIYLLIRRRLPSDIFPTWQDVVDFWQMLRYLLFFTRDKPEFGKFNFEQKLTYWFIFFGTGIMIISGLILWYPIAITQIFPGGIIPAAKMAHSTEALVAAVFIVIWHFFHVHLERLNLSMFTGRLSEEEMLNYHQLEYDRLMAEEEVQDEIKAGIQTEIRIEDQEEDHIEGGGDAA